MAENLKVNELDFDSIKANLKGFLKNQSEFKDFDFEGSSMAVLLDLLAYNTHYNAFYMNMIANEMFLDTAKNRDNVVSRAKMLGYTPRSMSSSKILAKIGVKVPTSVSPIPTVVIVPQYTKYKTTIDQKAYYFNTLDSHNAIFNRTEGEYHIFETPNVYLYEGTKIEQKFTYDKNNPSQRFILENSGADTSTLHVKVQRSATNLSTTRYTRASSITGLNSASNVYFLQEVEAGKYEVYFGDGNTGKSLEHDNVVIVDYVSTSGPAANGASEFKYTTPISGYEQDITLAEGNVKSSGGDIREDIESIRYLAPLNFNSQNRVVTATDYQTSILQNYGDVQAVSSWGGETNDPPVYGKVFIALKPKTGLTINEVAKNQIKDSILKSRNVVSITPEIVDPSYIFIKPNIISYFNREIGAYTATEIEDLIKANVLSFSKTDLEQFNSYFRYSKFLRTIDGSAPAIENSSLSVKLATNITLVPNQSKSISAAFSNAVFYPHEGHFGSIKSSTFTYFGDNQCYLSDDGAGIINIYRDIVGERRLVDTNKGTINYDTGVFKATFTPEGTGDTLLTVEIVPREQDVFSVRNQILEILANDIQVVALDSQNRYVSSTNTLVGETINTGVQYSGTPSSSSSSGY
jgi:uncharacterized protein YxeA